MCSTRFLPTHTRQFWHRRLWRPQADGHLGSPNRTEDTTDTSHQRHHLVRHMGRLIPILSHQHLCPSPHVRRPASASPTQRFRASRPFRHPPGAAQCPATSRLRSSQPSQAPIPPTPVQAGIRSSKTHQSLQIIHRRYHILARQLCPIQCPSRPAHQPRPASPPSRLLPLYPIHTRHPDARRPHPCPDPRSHAQRRHTHRSEPLRLRCRDRPTLF